MKQIAEALQTNKQETENSHEIKPIQLTNIMNVLDIVILIVIARKKTYGLDVKSLILINFLVTYRTSN